MNLGSRYLFSSNSLSFLLCLTPGTSIMASQLLFSHVINLLLTKFAQDCTIDNRLKFSENNFQSWRYCTCVVYVCHLCTKILGQWIIMLSTSRFCCLCKTTEQFFLVYTIIWIILIFVAVGNKSLWRCQILWQIECYT